MVTNFFRCISLTETFNIYLTIEKYYQFEKEKKTRLE